MNKNPWKTAPQEKLLGSKIMFFKVVDMRDFKINRPKKKEYYVYYIIHIYNIFVKLSSIYVLINVYFSG